MERMLMLRDFKLKGFSYPLTPKGISSVIPSFPWHYGTEYLNILFRADPSVVREFLPEPLELGPDPGLCYAAFSKWWSVSEEAKDMPSINPERTQAAVSRGILGKFVFSFGSTMISPWQGAGLWGFLKNWDRSI
jgi:hypothetical protein